MFSSSSSSFCLLAKNSMSIERHWENSKNNKKWKSFYKNCVRLLIIYLDKLERTNTGKIWWIARKKDARNNSPCTYNCVLTVVWQDFIQVSRI